MKQRILYIDELKGFAIFLVVVGHVFQFSFGSKDCGYVSVWLDFISSFHMPLFAFLSGLFIKEITSWSQLRKLLERFGIPMLVVGCLYALWRGKGLAEFFFNEFKFGYWYFLFLFTAYILVTLLEKVIRLVKIKNQRGTFIAIASLMYMAILFVGGGKYFFKNF